VAHCIASNTKAAKGVAPVLKMLEEGVTVGLGTDGPSSGNTLDLFIQMRFCANFHKNENRDRSAMPAEKIVSMATIEGARALGLDGITGSLEPGKEADIVVVETSSPNMFPVYEPYSALVYSANPSNVKDVYVAGKQVVKDRMILTADYMAIRRELKDRMNDTAFGEMGMLLS
jgi:cytosine/adenosine deaminase-related metal-dependent hydrolase